MKKLDRVTRNFRVCCLGIMGVGLVMYAAATLLR